MEAAGLAIGAIPLAALLAETTLKCYSLISALPAVATVKDTVAHDIFTEQLRLRRWKEEWHLDGDPGKPQRLDPSDYRYRYAVATLARIMGVFADVKVMGEKVPLQTQPERTRTRDRLKRSLTSRTRSRTPDPEKMQEEERLLEECVQVQVGCLEDKQVLPGLEEEIRTLESTTRRAQAALGMRERMAWELVHRDRFREVVDRLRLYNDQLYQVMPPDLVLEEIRTVVNGKFLKVISVIWLVLTLNRGPEDGVAEALDATGADQEASRCGRGAVGGDGVLAASLREVRGVECPRTGEKGFCKYCFVCLWRSRFREKHLEVRDWS